MIKQFFYSQLHTKIITLTFICVCVGVLTPVLGIGRDGTLDRSFGNHGFLIQPLEVDEFTWWESIIQLQSDGKIIIGTSCFGNALPRICLFRYDANGVLDPSFGSEGRVTSPNGFILRSLELQSDGKILAVGASLSDGGTDVLPDFAIIRYNPDGLIDESFGVNGIVITDLGFIEELSYDVIRKLIVLSDGKILAIGESYKYYLSDRTDAHLVMVRYNSDGSIDSTFGRAGFVSIQIAQSFPYGWSDDTFSATVQNDGRILVGTKLSVFRGDVLYRPTIIARFNVDGTLDPSFGKFGILELSGTVYITKIAQLDSGEILLLDYYTLTRLNSDGSIDRSFGKSGTVELPDNGHTYKDLTVDNYGNLILVGCLGPFRQSASSTITRYHSDGTLDLSFGLGGSTLLYDPANFRFGLSSIILDNDGRILVAGNGGTQLTDRPMLARFVNRSLAAAGKSLPYVPSNTNQTLIDRDRLH